MASFISDLLQRRMAQEATIPVNRYKGEIGTTLGRISRVMARQASLFACMQLTLEMWMSTREDLNAELIGLRDLISADQTSDQAVVDQLNGVIASLQDRIKTLETPENFDDIITTLHGIRDSIATVNAGGTSSSGATGGTEVNSSGPEDTVAKNASDDRLSSDR